MFILCETLFCKGKKSGQTACGLSPQAFLPPRCVRRGGQGKKRIVICAIADRISQGVLSFFDIQEE